MKIRYIRLLLAITILFAWLGFRSGPALAAGNCKNQSCFGKNPNTMGCPAYTNGGVKFLPDGRSTVETRISQPSDCDAKWARVINYSGGNRYTAGSIWYGCSNYCYNISVRSPAAIASGQQVYTAMVAYAGTPTRSCGAVSTSGPIGIPININDSWCTGAT